MKTFLLIAGLILLHLTISGQTMRIEHTIEDSNIKPWITKQSSDYQASYHFSNSDLESTLTITIFPDSCHAQLQSGKWVKNDNKVSWNPVIEAFKNVKIKGNKFYSDKTNGEFVSFSIDGENRKGLLVYKPWSTWIFYSTSEGYEIGAFIFPENKD